MANSSGTSKYLCPIKATAFEFNEFGQEAMRFFGIAMWMSVDGDFHYLLQDEMNELSFLCNLPKDVWDGLNELYDETENPALRDSVGCKIATNMTGGVTH